MKLGLPYRNRSEAGQLLGGELGDYRARPDALILGVANGGVLVAAEVAVALGVPFEVLVVRTILSSSPPGLTIGAIAPGGVRVLDRDLIRALGLSDRELDGLIHQRAEELHQRQQLYGAERPTPNLKDRTVILVDDGACTGWSMLAAIRFARQHAPKQVILAVPVASADALERLAHEADACVCPSVCKTCISIADSYWSFPKISDAEVMEWIARGPQDKA